MFGITLLLITVSIGYAAYAAYEIRKVAKKIKRTEAILKLYNRRWTKFDI